MTRKKWTCMEHDCDTVVVADSIEELVAMVNAHVGEAHNSFELEEMIEDVAEDVDDE